MRFSTGMLYAFGTVAPSSEGSVRSVALTQLRPMPARA